METINISWAPVGTRMLTVEPDISELLYQIHKLYSIRADTPEPFIIYNHKSLDIIKRHDFMVTALSSGHPYLLYIRYDGVKFTCFLINRFRPKDGLPNVLTIPLDISELWATGDWIIDTQLVSKSSGSQYDILLRNILVMNGRNLRDNWNNRCETLYKIANKIRPLTPNIHIKSCRFHKVADFASIREPWSINAYEFIPVDTKHLPIRFYINQKALLSSKEVRPPIPISSPSRIQEFKDALQTTIESADYLGHPALTDYPDISHIPIVKKTIKLGVNGTFQVINRNINEGYLRVHKLEDVLRFRELLKKSPTQTIEVDAYMDTGTNKWTVRAHSQN